MRGGSADEFLLLRRCQYSSLLGVLDAVLSGSAVSGLRVEFLDRFVGASRVQCWWTLALAGFGAEFRSFGCLVRCWITKGVGCLSWWSGRSVVACWFVEFCMSWLVRLVLEVLVGFSELGLASLVLALLLGSCLVLQLLLSFFAMVSSLSFSWFLRFC